MLSDYILIFLVALLPFIYKYSFWFYTIQLKEYRWDRFKDYLFTPQWRSAIFNFWFFIEFPLFLLTITVLFDKTFEIITYQVIFYFLLIQNIFVIGKIFRRKILKPKITWRLLITTIILSLWIATDLYWIFSSWHNAIISTYLIGILLFAPIIIFLCIWISLPLVLYLKNKRMKKASIKSKNVKNTTIIWITGSYWKSSVKEYLSSILEQEWKTLKTPENQNTEMWVSNLILRDLDDSYKYFVAEMWAYKRWEIETLWNIANHKYGFLTAVWTQHIWLFWSIENTKKAKSEIAKKVEENKGTLYINWENENVRSINFSKNINIIKYWNTKWSDIVYNIKSSSDQETSFNITYKNKNISFKTNLIWSHNILNLSWVIAFCIDVWIDEKKLKEYVTHLSKPKNTLEIMKLPNYTLINDSYNLPENWALAAIEVLSTYKWNKVLIMDDIFELWKRSEEIHVKLWKRIAEEWKVNKVLFIWSNFWGYFKKWLLDWWFLEINILNRIQEIEKWSTILFEWRTSRKYLDKIIKWV